MTNPKFNTLPIVDWQLGLKLTGNKRELAEEMLSALIKTLPEEVSQLSQLKTMGEDKKLLQQLHRLHGAVCYCGLPRLKQAISTLENALKKGDNKEIPLLFDQFKQEVVLLLNETGFLLT